MVDNDAVTARPSSGREYRILIENSEYWLRNNGDLAMLAVTVDRLQKHWPSAQIGVMTDSPLLLSAYCPGARGITRYSQDPWARPGRLQRLAATAGPAFVGPGVVARLRGCAWFAPRARHGRDRLLDLVSNVSHRRSAQPQTAAAATTEPTDVSAAVPDAARAVREATLVVALGGGYLTDSDRPQARRVLDLLGYAKRSGVPVAVIGQGLGPLRDPDLRSRAAAVLPGVDVIALRERRRGPALLAELGVSPDKVMITGDDAIEMSYATRRNSVGADIGICLRVADYAPVAQVAQKTVGTVVRAAAASFGVGLVPLMIAEHPGSPDRKTTMPLVRGAARVRAPLGRFASPQQVAARVAECRILVTGAYHLAVFALSQGIPVVGLTTTEYYDDKFLGLVDMFGGGLDLVHLSNDDLSDRLDTAISAAWKTTDSTRADLRDRAVVQIDASKRAFDAVFDLVDRHDGAL
ncbi:polysaccharide pyruvyl transferase family protein [Antrihabitans spumae]|uniref:Polysaccharide pyruvyl transferase family protein n=1 Tax=Antrihabitans spumae TaxID=3373370 RepID=A0ABW7KG01_9NOCA